MSARCTAGLAYRYTGRNMPEKRKKSWSRFMLHCCALYTSRRCGCRVFDVWRQVKFRKLSRHTHELAIAPQVHGLFHTLEADAYLLPAQPGIQIKFQRIAADGSSFKSTCGGRSALRPSHGYSVLVSADHSLGLHMARHTDGTKARKDPLLRARNRRALGRAALLQSATCRPAAGAGCCSAARLSAQYGSIHGPNGHPAGSRQTQSGSLNQFSSGVMIILLNFYFCLRCI